jgi:hypothetical protein
MRSEINRIKARTFWISIQYGNIDQWQLQDRIWLAAAYTLTTKLCQNINLVQGM